MQHLREAAVRGKGNTDAQYEIGRLLFEGRQVNRDLKEAAMWLLKAAKGGHGPAQRLLGFQLLFALGIPENKSKGIDLMSRAAKQGDLEAKLYMHSKDFANIDQISSYVDKSANSDKDSSISSAQILADVTMDPTSYLVSEFAKGERPRKEIMRLAEREYNLSEKQVKAIENTIVRLSTFNLDKVIELRNRLSRKWCGKKTDCVYYNRSEVVAREEFEFSDWASFIFRHKRTTWEDKDNNFRRVIAKYPEDYTIRGCWFINDQESLLMTSDHKDFSDGYKKFRIDVTGDRHLKIYDFPSSTSSFTNKEYL